MALPHIPGYSIRRELGKGGMAAVYLARQDALEREVALKLLTPAMLRHAHQTERFLRERKTVAGLNHRHIVTVHDSGLSEGCYYLAMELLSGGTLEERLERNGKLAPDEALGITRALADALRYAHGKGLVHRDIKPLNIMFREDGAPVLTDFGIVKLLEDSGGLTETGTTIGSVQYMSPEQARGRKLDGRSDLYSLGVVLYRMLTGELPFKGDNAAALVFQHASAPIPRLPGDVARFQCLIDKLLAKSPDERYADAAALIAAIDDLKSRQAPLESTQKATPEEIEEAMEAQPPKPTNEQPESVTTPLKVNKLAPFALLGLMLAAIAYVLIERADEPFAAIDAEAPPPCGQTRIAANETLLGLAWPPREAGFHALAAAYPELHVCGLAWSEILPAAGPWPKQADIGTGYAVAVFVIALFIALLAYGCLPRVWRRQVTALGLLGVLGGAWLLGVAGLAAVNSLGLPQRGWLEQVVLIQRGAAEPVWREVENVCALERVLLAEGVIGTARLACGKL